MQAKKKIVYKLVYLLEVRLQATGDWQVAPPKPEAFASQEPFCVDTMSYPQWLKYVFIPRMQALLDADAALPQQCALTPQLEMQLPSKSQAAVGEVTQAIDDLLTEGKTPPASLLKQAGA